MPPAPIHSFSFFQVSCASEHDGYKNMLTSITFYKFYIAQSCRACIAVFVPTC